MFALESRKVAITGATGFVGHHAALELQRSGAVPIALVRSTSDVSRLRAAGIESRIVSLDGVDSLVRGLAGCDAVVHCAAAVGFDDDWHAYARVNVDGTRNLVESCRRAGVGRFLHASSIVTVAAQPLPMPADENAVWNLGRYRVPYVTTKRLAEEIALAAGERSGGGLDVIVVNPGNVVGPDDFAGSEFGVLCKRFWRGRLPIHFGGGGNFVDVRDVALGIRSALERGRAGQRYLLTSANRTYSAFFFELARAAGRAIPRFRLPTAIAPVVGFLNDRLTSKQPYLSAAQARLMGLFFYFDDAKARHELGWKPRPLAVSLSDAHAFWMDRGPKRARSA